MVLSLAIAVLVTDVPSLPDLFGTRPVPLEFWFLPIPLGLGVLCVDEVRNLIVRLWPNGTIARIAW